MVLNLPRIAAVLCFAVLISVSQPGIAHKNHVEATNEQIEQAGPPPAGSTRAMQDMMGDHAKAMEEERPTTFFGRLIDWLGRTHPFAVHFPIALIPASWLALLIARRRGHAVDVIRAVIILAAVAAVGAAIVGWFNAGFVLADRDPVQLAHRWVGTVLALIVGAVGIWAWRRTHSLNSRAMVWVLGGTTVLLLVQGWLGAALVHGIDHMNF